VVRPGMVCFAFGAGRKGAYIRVRKYGESGAPGADAVRGVCGGVFRGGGSARGRRRIFVKVSRYVWFGRSEGG
jgi:hypothetical protein